MSEGISNYSIQKCIGRGNFGDVYSAISQSSGEVVAIKVVHLDASEDDVAVFIQEIQLLSRMRSNYVTKYFETFVNQMSIWIVMEYCGGGSCSDLLKCHKKLNEEVVGYIIRGAMLGLNYLHLQKKVHRDIKSANILLTDDGSVKLADFGVSGEITMTNMKRNTFVGTPFWMAPEVIKRKSGGYDEKADIWSMGITVIELVTGMPPLAEHDPMKVLFTIPANKPPTLDKYTSLSLNIKDFVKYCLRKDPNERPTAKVLLHHRFLKIRRNVGILQLISERNKWMEEKYANGKKPKYNLGKRILQAEKYYSSSSDSIVDNPSNNIQWDFGTQKSFHVCSSSSPLTSSLPQTNNISSSTAVSSPPNQSPVELSGPPKVGSNNYLEEVIIQCLGKVAQRAKTSETKRTVEMLARSFISCESMHPGMCEAIVEEIYLQINELLANEKQ